MEHQDIHKLSVTEYNITCEKLDSN